MVVHLVIFSSNNNRFNNLRLKVPSSSLVEVAVEVEVGVEVGVGVEVKVGV